MSKNNQQAVEQWDQFQDIPIDDNECIDVPFLHFEAGTTRFDIWHWFEEHYDINIGDLITGEYNDQ